MSDKFGVALLGFRCQVSGVRIEDSAGQPET
jgi:hypothetical protein